MAEQHRIDGREIEFALSRRGEHLAVVFHGGHLRAELGLGHESFLDAGWSVLQPSRPGYGGTPLAAGPDAAGFSDRIALLCRSLGFDSVCAVGVSAGARTAMTFAARHPDLVQGLILESPTSFAAWPDSLPGRIAARMAFNPITERASWAVARAAFRVAPRLTLRSMMGSLSTLPPSQVTQDMNDEERARLLTLFGQTRSNRGFLNDLRNVPQATPAIRQPALIVASRNDGAVSVSHSLDLARRIPGAELVMVDSQSHLLWVGPNADQERTAVRKFLANL